MARELFPIGIPASRQHIVDRDPFMSLLETYLSDRVSVVISSSEGIRLLKKRLAALGTIVLVATGCGSGTGPSLNPSPQTVRTFSASYVSMATKGAGWALRLGRVAVFHTADGTTWTDVTPPAIPKGAPTIMYALSGSEAWVAYSGPKDDIVVLRTDDAGSSWTRSTIAFHSPPTAGRLIGPSSMEFVTARTGWLCVDVGGGMQSVGVLYRTEDGGATWETVSASRSGQPDSLPFSGKVEFTSPESGWIVGGSFTTTDNELFRTADAGREWKKVSFPAPTNDSTETAEIASFWPRRSTAMMVVTFPDGSYLYGTRDSGVHWTYRPLPSGFTTADMLTGVTIVAASGNTIYRFTAVDPTQSRTSTLGKSSADLSVFELDFADPERGWAIVAGPNLAPGSGLPISQPTLYLTTDGGASWRSSGFKVAKQ